ncbi:hypothetical protein [Dyadobacter frigoris]|uniref:Peptidase metallopeptidase domain-containing protein n=1 Tax=Dyadobacter frigoris TaxID=2576211 RepID=A0A4U6DA91_9BACT|nr:hypothetical protein [Dyadobacter frigoris]TKT93301.1 hypothetical protein FDK13_05465 [Dyadobacter frigoris]
MMKKIKFIIGLMLIITMDGYSQQESTPFDMPDIIYISPQNNANNLRDQIAKLYDLINNNSDIFKTPNKKASDKILPLHPDDLLNTLRFESPDTVSSNFFKLEKTLKDTDKSIQTIIDRQHRWPTQTILKVCYIDRDKEELAKKIFAIAFEWNKNQSIKLVLDDPKYLSSCDGCINCVRVSTNSNRLPNELRVKSDWAAVGSELRSVTSTQKATVYFHKLENVVDKNDEFRSRVLHEFGHVLGIMHEHQYPLNNECKIDGLRASEALITRIKTEEPSTQITDLLRHDVQEIVRINYLPLTSASLYDFGEKYDEFSVLNYSLTKDFFAENVKMECYNHPRRSALSDNDIIYFDNYYRRILVPNTIAFQNWKFNDMNKSLKPKNEVSVDSNNDEEILKNAKKTLQSLERFVRNQIALK